MDIANCGTSSCRYCRSYQPQGRRGGMCHKLGVEVQSQWKSCALAKPIFDPSWNDLGELMLLEKSFCLECETERENIPSSLELESLFIEQ